MFFYFAASGAEPSKSKATLIKLEFFLNIHKVIEYGKYGSKFGAIKTYEFEFDDLAFTSFIVENSIQV